MMSKIFRQTCWNRAFELEVAKAYDEKLIKSPIYLSLGQEHIPATVLAHDWAQPWQVFTQHRCHSWALSLGMPPFEVGKQILGRQGSASISSSAVNLFGHSGLLGDQVPIGVGAAHASGKPTLVVLGDAALEEGYVLEALGYAATKRCPVLFICEDNDLSILTRKAIRRHWNAKNVANGFGLRAHDVKDNPVDILQALHLYANELPLFLNINTCRERWHAGTGVDGPKDWDTFGDLANKVSHSDAIWKMCKFDMEAVWARLRKQFAS